MNKEISMIEKLNWDMRFLKYWTLNIQMNI